MSEVEARFLLSDLLDVDPLDDSLFLGHRIAESKGRVFGGQVLGQALMAAAKTVSADKLVHSAHNYFIRPGDCEQPIHYQVCHDLDGRSFCNRRVIALQNDRPIFNLIASFQAPEQGLHHQKTAPLLAGPEGLLNENELAEKYVDQLPEGIYPLVSRYRPIEVRPLNEAAHFLKMPVSDSSNSPTQAMWFRAKESLNDNRAMHRAILGYATDLTLLSASGRPHGITWALPGVRTASLDHALWIHSADIRTDQWLLYVMDSPWSGSGRGLNFGSIFTQDGELIASVAQEGLIRVTT